MEPYVIHWLDDIERDFRQSRRPAKADYVYFLPRISTHRWEHVRVEALHTGTIMAPFPPPAAMDEERKAGIVAATKDLRELIRQAWHLPEKLLAGWIHVHSVDPAGRASEPKRRPGGEMGREKKGGQQQVPAKRPSPPTDSAVDEPPRGPLASLAELARLDINPHRLAYTQCARVIAQSSPPIWTSPPRGLGDLFKEADLRKYLQHTGR